MDDDDDERENFEVTDWDLQNEFNPNRQRHWQTKEEATYGVWAERDSDEERPSFGGKRYGLLHTASPGLGVGRGNRRGGPRFFSSLVLLSPLTAMSAGRGGDGGRSFIEFSHSPCSVSSSGPCAGPCRPGAQALADSGRH
jgi:hypothetical protein